MEDAQRRAIEKSLLEEKAKEDDGNSDMGFSSAYNKFEQFKPAAPTTTPTGMTPNAVSPTGEAYSSWGARTGDWGAMQGPAEQKPAAGMGNVANSIVAAVGFKQSTNDVTDEKFGKVGSAIMAALVPGNQ
jgi:hypothetical protein